MKVRWMAAALVLLVAMVAVVGCSKRQVTRIDPDTTVDLSGRWNDTDSRLVAQEMIGDCLGSPWKMNYVEAEKKKPTLIVGVLRNKSSEHIAMDTFINDIERAFIMSNEVTMVASAEEREQIREERADQQTYSTEETMKKWGRELGADYMLGGTISSIMDQEKNEKVVFYQVDMTLINLENSTKVWLGQKKIKKYIGRSKVSF